MREIRLYGSEGGEAKAFPTPITLAEVNTIMHMKFSGIGVSLSWGFRCESCEAEMKEGSKEGCR